MIGNIFKPNINTLGLTDMSVDVSQIPLDAQNNVKDYVTTAPQVYYYGVQIGTDSIREFRIISTGFIPEINIVFVDSTGLIRSDNFPVDDSVISVYIPSSSPLTKDVRMDFKILEYSESSSGAESLSCMKCIASIPNFYLRQFKSYPNMTSWKTLYNIAGQCGMGFNSNINDTVDSMTWLNPGENSYWMVQDMLPHTWNGDSGFTWAFVDFYYNLNYIDIEVAMEDSDVPQAPLSALNPAVGLNTDTLSQMLFTNDSSYSTTKNYFNRYAVNSKSTLISLQNGYAKKVAYYDRAGNWDKRAGSLQIFTVDSISTPGSQNTSVILKGNPTDLSFYNNNISYEWFGKIDTDNTHTNYGYATVQNSQNIDDLQKVSVTITLPSPNYAVVRFQKIYLMFTKRATSDENTRMSGYWLVTGVSYIYTKNNGFVQEITLVKRELKVT